MGASNTKNNIEIQAQVSDDESQIHEGGRKIDITEKQASS